MCAVMILRDDLSKQENAGELKKIAVGHWPRATVDLELIRMGNDA